MDDEMSRDDVSAWTPAICVGENDVPLLRGITPDLRQDSLVPQIRSSTPAADDDCLLSLPSPISLRQNVPQPVTSSPVPTLTSEFDCSVDQNRLQSFVTAMQSALDESASGRSLEAVTLIETENVICAGNANAEKHSREYLEIKIDNAKRVFVQTKAYELAKGSLESDNHVTILGVPGAGKTTLSLVLLHKYKQKGYDFHFVDRLDQFNFKKQIDSKKRTILVLDDVFGQIGVRDIVGHQEVFDFIESYWEHQQAKGKPKNKKSRQADRYKENNDESENEVNLKVVFTSRTNILKEIHNTTGKYKYTLFKDSTVIDLTNGMPLNTVEKQKILISHLKEKGLELKGNDVFSIAAEASSNLGFPYMCKLFTTVKHFQNSPKDFFLKPMAYLVNTMEILVESKESQAATGALVLMVLCDGRMNLANISNTHLRKKSGLEIHLQSAREYVSFSDSASFPKILVKAARTLIGTYFIEELGQITFSHPAIYDAVSFIIGRNDPDFVLSHCSMQFIHEKVQVPSLDQEKLPMADEYEFNIYITSDFHDVFIERLANELGENNFSLVLSHQALGNSDILNGVFDTLLQENTIHDILHSRDHEYGRSFLFWTTFAISETVTEKSLDITDFKLQEIAEGVLGCCLSGKKETLAVLISRISSSSSSPLANYVSVKFSVSLPPQHGQFGSDPTKKNLSVFEMINTMPVKDILHKETDTRAFLRNLSTASDTENTSFSEEANCSIHGDPNDKPLHIASANAHLEVVKMLLDNGGDVNIRGGLGRTPLMYASRGGHCRLVEILLENRADVSLCDEEGATCLHLASRGGHRDVMKVFVDKGMDVNAKGEHGRTPLLYACRYGHSDLVTFLLAHGGDTNLTCEGDNCLHLACVGGNLDSVKILINRGMDIETEGQQKKTPLMYACRRGHLNVVNFLISKGAKFDLQDVNGATSLHLAANAGKLELVKRLVDLGLQAYAVDKNGKTPVSTAIFRGHLELVNFFFDHCHIDCGTLSDMFPLYLPCLTGDVAMVNLLLSFKIDVNYRNGPMRRTPLMNAYQKGHTEIIDVLMRAGADISAVDQYGAMCIHLASKAGKVNLVTTLLDNGCDINIQGQNNWTPVMYACRYCNRDIFDLLVERGADTSLVDFIGGNCIHLLCRGTTDDAYILIKLIDLGVDFEALDKFHKSPLLYASSNGLTKCLELLCQKGADFKMTDVEGTNSLHFACQGGHTDIVLYLLALGFDINGRGQHGLTPLMYVCWSKAGNLDLIELLVDKGADCSLTDDYGANCLHLSCQHGHEKTVQKLLDLKLKLNSQGQNNWTPVMYACRYGHRKVLDVLLNCTDEMCLTGCDINGSSCLHLACWSGQIDVVMKLLDLGLDINGTDQHGQSPVMYACQSGNIDLLKVLWEKGADTKLSDKFGRNCLHLSCMANKDNVDIVETLVEMGLHIDGTDAHKRTSLMYACKYGHSKIFEFLLSKNADVSITDIDGANCLTLAKNGGHKDIENRLLKVMHA